MSTPRATSGFEPDRMNADQLADLARRHTRARGVVLVIFGPNGAAVETLNVVGSFSAGNAGDVAAALRAAADTIDAGSAVQS